MITSNLINNSILNNIDPTGIHKAYDKWGNIAEDCFYNGNDFSVNENVNQIIFTGMGSSGTISDVFETLFSQTNLSVSVVKGYVLPRNTDSNTLLVATSISGNTDEILTIVNEARNRNCKIISFSDGGELEKYCLKHKVPFNKIGMLHSPRASTIAFLYGMLKTLLPIIPITKSQVSESIRLLKEMQKKINSENMKADNEALELASWLRSPPVIFYPNGLKAAAVRLKNSLQENSKMHASVEDVIEASHNAIVAWENPSNMRPFLLQGNEEHPKTRERWNILKEYFTQNNISYKEVHAVNGDILSKLICLIYLFDYTSIYRAIMSGVDPSPVKSIDFIKEKISGQAIPTESLIKNETSIS